MSCSYTNNCPRILFGNPPCAFDPLPSFSLSRLGLDVTVVSLAITTCLSPSATLARKLKSQTVASSEPGAPLPLRDTCLKTRSFMENTYESTCLLPSKFIQFCPVVKFTTCFCLSIKCTCSLIFHNEVGFNEAEISFYSWFLGLFKFNIVN